MNSGNVQKNENESSDGETLTPSFATAVEMFSDSSEAMDLRREEELLGSPVKDPEAEPPGNVTGSDKGTSADKETRTDTKADLDKLAADQQRAKAEAAFSSRSCARKLGIRFVRKPSD